MNILVEIMRYCIYALSGAPDTDEVGTYGSIKEKASTSGHVNQFVDAFKCYIAPGTY